MPPIVDALARLVLALDELTPTERETVLETRIRWLRETLERAERLLELRTATTPWPPEDGEADRHAAYAWLELRDERRALLVEQDRADAATIVRLEIAARDRETFFEMISGR